jgi:hypothetical protein
MVQFCMLASQTPDPEVRGQSAQVCDLSILVSRQPPLIVIFPPYIFPHYTDDYRSMGQQC